MTFTTRKERCVFLRILNGETYRHVSETYGVTPERIRQLSEKCFRKLRRLTIKCDGESDWQSYLIKERRRRIIYWREIYALELFLLRAHNRLLRFAHKNGRRAITGKVDRLYFENVLSRSES